MRGYLVIVLVGLVAGIWAPTALAAVDTGFRQEVTAVMKPIQSAAVKTLIKIYNDTAKAKTHNEDPQIDKLLGTLLEKVRQGANIQYTADFRLRELQQLQVEIQLLRDLGFVEPYSKRQQLAFAMKKSTHLIVTGQQVVDAILQWRTDIVSMNFPPAKQEYRDFLLEQSDMILSFNQPMMETLRRQMEEMRAFQ